MVNTPHYILWWNNASSPLQGLGVLPGDGEHEYLGHQDHQSTSAAQGNQQDTQWVLSVPGAGVGEGGAVGCWQYGFDYFFWIFELEFPVRCDGVKGRSLVMYKIGGYQMIVTSNRPSSNDMMIFMIVIVLFKPQKGWIMSSFIYQIIHMTVLSRASSSLKPSLGFPSAQPVNWKPVLEVDYCPLPLLQVWGSWWCSC